MPVESTKTKNSRARARDQCAIVILPHRPVVPLGPAMEQHDNPLSAFDQMGTTPSAIVRYEGSAGEQPTSDHQAANTSQYAEAMPAGDRAKGTFCYLATAPVNYFATRNQSDFLLHHWRQSLALSFLCACTFGLMIALLIPTVWLLLTRDRAELALSSSQVIAVIFLLVAAALAVAGLAGMFTAARGSMRPLPV
jgi:hypothetical protein